MKTIQPMHVSRLFMVVLAALFLIIQSCTKEQYTQTTTDDVNITGYLAKDAEQFSLMTQIIARSGSEGYLSAYGTYTLFTPTNTAITEWLKSIGKSAVDQVPVEDLKKMVTFHLVIDTLGTRNFNDGKIRTLTAYGQYLTSSAVNNGTTTTYLINKQATILKSNIVVGNGMIHVIDHVLTPQVKTLAKLIEENPRYSIFTAVLKETGFYDSLNVLPPAGSSRRFQTVILESDSAINAAGYASYNALKASLSKSGNPKNPADSLWLYAAYHISIGANYLADIVTTSSLTTLAPDEVVSTKLSGTKVLLNEVEFNGKIEPGIPLNRGLSDKTASNGVINEASTFYKIKFRVPTALFWDVTDIEVLRSQPNYRRAYISMIANGQQFIPGYFFQSIEGQTPGYQYSGGAISFAPGATEVRQNYLWNLNDFLSVAMTVSPTQKLRSRYFDMRTPLLVKGRYKVWMCYGNDIATQANSGGTMQVIMNPGSRYEQTLPNLLETFRNTANVGVDVTDPNFDNLLEAQGYKRYMASVNDFALNSSGVLVPGDAPVTYTRSTGRFVGIADIRTTDRQWVRVNGVKVESNNSICLDMIHFIPENEAEQQYPKFSRAGLRFNRP